MINNYYKIRIKEERNSDSKYYISTELRRTKIKKDLTGYKTFLEAFKDAQKQIELLNKEDGINLDDNNIIVSADSNIADFSVDEWIRNIIVDYAERGIPTIEAIEQMLKDNQTLETYIKVNTAS